MRIVVSGTHASGKSTVISDFALQHPEFTVLPDPFELLDEGAGLSGASLGAQLRLSAERLLDPDLAADVIAERGPLDFLAYLLAAAELGGRELDGDVLAWAARLTSAALARVDLLVMLPLSPETPIAVDDEEHPALRDAVDQILQDLLDDPDLVPESLHVAVLVGDQEARLHTLGSLVASHQGH